MAHEWRSENRRVRCRRRPGRSRSTCQPPYGSAPEQQQHLLVRFHWVLLLLFNIPIFVEYHEDCSRKANEAELTEQSKQEQEVKSKNTYKTSCTVLVYGIVKKILYLRFCFPGGEHRKPSLEPQVSIGPGFVGSGPGARGTPEGSRQRPPRQRVISERISGPAIEGLEHMAGVCQQNWCPTYEWLTYEYWKLYQLLWRNYRNLAFTQKLFQKLVNGEDTYGIKLIIDDKYDIYRYIVYEKRI